MGTHKIEMAEPEWTPATLAAHVRSIFADPGYAPPNLPQVALEIMALSQRPNVEIRQIAALIERDPVIAARLLKIANSAAYRGAAPIRTLHEAVQRLGLSMLRDLVMAEALSMRVFRTSGGYAVSLEELRVHSMVTAHLTRLVAMETSFDVEYAFLCGLLHDIGFAAILLAVGNVGRGKAPPSMELLWPVAEEAHAAVGGVVGRLWNLPPDVTLVIERHGQVRVDGRGHPLLAAIQVAEHLALDLGVGLLPKLDGGVVLFDVDVVHPAETTVARAALRLDDAALGRLHTAAEKIVASLT